jgi:hypothetical protein
MGRLKVSQWDYLTKKSGLPLKGVNMFTFIIMVLVTTIVAVAAVAISLVTFWLKLRKRLWNSSLSQLASLIVSMERQFIADESDRQYKWDQEQKVLRGQAVAAAAARREKASLKK